MMTDPIADMLTRIRNGALVRKHEVSIPYSRLKLALANLLVREEYLQKAEVTKNQPSFIVVTLKYSDDQSAINSLKRVSTPGHRRYIKSGEVRPVLNGLGLVILSTPLGLLTGDEARRAKVGGEVLCEVY